MVRNLTDVHIDHAHLFKLRLIVARVGEMDNARWWNTNGLLGQLGTIALKRGFPKTYAFAQARAVFAVASNRCAQVFDPPGGITLWKVPATTEDQFNTQWATWIEGSQKWEEFLEKVRQIKGSDPIAALLDLEVIQDGDVEETRKLKRASDNRAVPLPGIRSLSNETLTLLAAGFFRGEPGQLAVPYAKIEE
jgi:hypothetical protein